MKNEGRHHLMRSSVYPNFKAYKHCALLAFSGVLFGYDSAFISLTLAQPSFVKEFDFDVLSAAARLSTIAQITASFQLGAVLGTFIAYFTIESFGRRKTLIYASLIFLAGAALQTFASHRVNYIVWGRGVSGVGIGFITSAAPSFIAELAPVAVRGRLVGFFEMSYQLGAVVGFWFNHFLNKLCNQKNAYLWRVPMGFQCIPALVLLYGSISVPEAPLYYIKMGLESTAKDILSDLRQKDSEHEDIRAEIDAITQALEYEKAILKGQKPTLWKHFRASVKEASLPGIRNRLGAAFLMFAFANSSGALVLNYYSPQIFDSMHIANISLFTGLYGLFKAISTMIFLTFFIDKVGRRKPWIISSILCAVCMLLVAGYVFRLERHLATTSLQNVFATGSILTFAVTWAFGASSIPWTVCSEIMPLSIRGFCSVFVSLVQWMCQYIITEVAPFLLASLGWGAFVFFACSLFLSALWFGVCMPETNQVRIADMDELFGFEHSAKGYSYIQDED